MKNYKQRMRVLVLTTTLPIYEGDAVPSFVLDLAQEMAVQMPAEVTIVAPMVPGAAKSQRFGEVSVRRFRYLPFGLGALGSTAIVPALRKRPVRLLEASLLLVGLLFATLRWGRTIRPSIIHAHWIIPTGSVAVWASRVLACRPKVLVSSHGADVFALQGTAFHRWRLWVARSADVVMPASTALAAELDVPTTNVAPMGASGLFSGFEAQRAENAPFLFVGRLDSKKGVDVLLRAAAAVQGLKLRIAGDGPLRKDLESLAHTLNLTGRVMFLGALTKAQVAREMSQAGALVIPSVVTQDGDRESGPVVALEAVLSRLPIISSRLGEVPTKLLSDGATALIVSPGDEVELIRALSRLWEDRRLQRRIADAAYSELAERASMRFTAARYTFALDEKASGAASYSVIIPVHNRPEMVKRAVTSALAQNLLPLEIVVVDDGSTEQLVDLPSGGCPVRVIAQENAGAAAARNVGARVARGSHLAFLDSDDEWHDDHLCRIDRAFTKSPEAVMVYTLARQSSSVLSRLPYGFLKLRHLHARRLGWPSPLQNTPATVVRRDVFENLGGFYTALRMREDTDLFVRLAEVGKVEAIKRITVTCNRQPDGLSSKAHAALAEAERYSFAVLERQIARRSLTGSISLGQSRSMRREAHRFWAKMYFVRGKFSEALRHGSRGYLPWMMTQRGSD